MKSFIDSDILIWHLRGKPEALKFLRELFEKANTEPLIGAMQRAEIVFFMRPHEEKQTLEFLKLFKTISVTEEIIDIASKYYKKYAASHAIDINDTILAATCLVHGGKIFTLNKKHYPMRDIVIEKPW